MFASPHIDYYPRYSSSRIFDAQRIHTIGRVFPPSGYTSAPIHRRLFARVFTTLTCSGVVSRNDARSPPPQLTPGRSLTCLRLPGFAFSAPRYFLRLFHRVRPLPPSLCSPFPAFRSEIPEPKPTAETSRATPLLPRLPACLTRPVAGP